MTEFAHKPLPPRALAISLVALAVPALSSFLAPEWMTDDDGVLIWLTALVPAFLFVYYKGWQGVSVALALGMAVLTAVHVVLLLLDLSQPDWSLLPGVVVVYISVCLGLGTFADLLRRAEQQALTDMLTALPNRRHAMLVLERAFACAVRGAPFCVALFDIDDFKEFTDRHGHEAGDRVLKIFAGVLKGCTREMNLSSRFGGEKFLSVLLDTQEGGAQFFAERVRQRLKETQLPWGPITVSGSVAAYSEEMGTIEDLVAAADQALYAAKNGGRDRVVLAGPRPVSGSAEATSTKDRSARPMDDSDREERRKGELRTIDKRAPGEASRSGSPDPGPANLG